MSSDLYQTIGGRIRRARESAAMSQQELAQKIGYSSSATISHFETGERKISIVDLQRVAQTLGLPTDYFLQAEVKSQEVQHFWLRAEEIRPTVRETVVAFLSFAQKHGRSSLDLPPGIEKLKAGKAAERILKAALISEPPVSPRDVASCIGVPVFEWDFPDDISGIFVCDRGKFCIGVNEFHPRVRQRFSTAHEIGHLVFDSAKGLFFDFVGVEAIADLESLKDIETERRANQFAAELLMPAPWLKKDVSQYGVDLTFLAKRYEVSQQALWFRLLNLKLVNGSMQHLP